jgi:hypothetical protein
MPGFNQTGPMGQGPMTGRRMGRCANYGANLKNQTNDESEDSNKPNADNMAERGWGWGRGMGGRGRGRGMGQQNRFRGGG